MSSTSSGSLVHALRQNWLGKTAIAVQSFLLAVAFVVVGLRVWTRRRQRVSLQGNDWFILAATVVMLGRYIVELLLVLLCGMGIHTDEVVRLGGSETLVRFNKLTYVGELLWVTVVALVQLSILHYYFRRFQQPIIMRLTCVLIGLCSSLWIASLLANAFLCTPPRKVWLASEEPEGACGDRKMLHTGCAVSELILNIFILLLPIPILRHMKFSRKGGISLASTYVLGLVIIGLSALRVDTKLFLISKDSTYGSAPESLVSSIVTLLGIIAACLPVLAPASQRVTGTPECKLISESPRPDPATTRYWKATVSGGQMEEPEIPLVTVTQAPVGKRPGFNEWALGQIKITSDWEIHSTRNSARLDKDSIRRG